MASGANEDDNMSSFDQVTSVTPITKTTIFVRAE